MFKYLRKYYNNFICDEMFHFFSLNLIESLIPLTNKCNVDSFAMLQSESSL